MPYSDIPVSSWSFAVFPGLYSGETPHVAQVPPLQARPAPVHTSPEQQVWPALAPHAVHMPPTHAKPLAVQVAVLPVPQHA